MTFFQEVYDRIRHATNARTQTELAAVLEIRQSSISDAKRRNSVPADWYMKLFEKFGLNPDWIKSGMGPMFLKIDQEYTPMEGLPAGFREEPALYADPTAVSALVNVYSMQCLYEEGQGTPEFQTKGKIALPQTYAGAQTLVFLVESDSFFPLIRRGAYVGLDTSRTHPVSGEIYGVFMPHEGMALKRLFLDTSEDRFLLKTEQAAHPGVTLSPEDSQKRIYGRVAWVLQQL